MIEVGRVRPLEGLDLPEHEDVLHPGHRGRHDVEGARCVEPAGDAPHAVVLEVLEQGLVRGQGAGPDPGADVAVLVGQRVAPEGGREPRFAFDLDDQHARARTGGRGRQRRA